MISIQITEHGIQMSGHAQCKESDGIDRACAAVSALTCNLINSLMELTGDRIRADTESGMAIVEWEKLSDKGKLLVDSWFVDDWLTRGLLTMHHFWRVIQVLSCRLQSPSAPSPTSFRYSGNSSTK